MTHHQPTGSSELGRFLRARRSEVTPHDVGIATGPGQRRTPGLRREELAALAGVSVDYYIRLERGREVNPSPSVVEALARSLNLAPVERRHLRELVAQAQRRVDDPPSSATSLPPGTRHLLESLRPNPAYVVNLAGDLLAHNPGCLRLLVGIEEWPENQRNMVRFLFLHPAARTLFRDWDQQITSCVARLRRTAATSGNTTGLAELVDELRRHSPEFAELWERYDVKGRAYGRKRFQHPDLGRFELGYQAMALDGTTGHRLIAYYADPGSPDHDVMSALDQAPAHRPFLQRRS